MTKDKSNNAVVIRKGIPMPMQGPGNATWRKYEWDKMEVGDSFLFPEDIKSESAHNITKYAGLRKNKQFKARKLPDGRMGCWRIA